MPYVQRDGNNKIIGLFTMRQEFAQESLTDDHPDVVAFRAPPPPDPTDEKVRKRIQSDPTLRALVKRTAVKEGVPFGQLLNEIAAEAD